VAIRKLIENINTSNYNGDPWFIKAIERFFKTEANKNERDGGYFRPSGITQCARLNLYNYLNVAPFIPPDTASMRRMIRGTEHHRIWYDIFVAAGIDVSGGDNEKTLVSMKHPTIYGHYDWIIKDREKLEYLIEWKSSEYLNPKLSWEHKTQWNLYSYMLKIPRGFLIKENPATLELLPIKMELDKEYAEEILSWLIMIENAALNKEMLDYASSCGPGHPWRKTCSIYDFCHGNLGCNPWELTKIGED